MKPIEYQVKHLSAQKLKSDCLIVPYDGKELNAALLQILLKQSPSQLKSTLNKHKMQGSYGQLLALPRQDEPSTYVLLVGVGENKLQAFQFEELLTRIWGMLNTLGIQECLFCIADFTIQYKNVNWKIQYTIQILESLQYQFDKFKSTKKNVPSCVLRCQFKINSKSELRGAQKAVDLALAIHEGILFAKDLANTPSNVCTPSYIAQEAKKLAKQSTKTSCAVLSEKQIEALGMGLFLSVTQASQQEAKLITLEYRNAPKDQKPIVLVGKGITFDTGGNSIKVPPNMIGMKYDMCGAATVLGVIKAVSALALPMNLIGVIPSCENSVGSHGTKPEDIVKSMSGQMVEILNTDAEGRLILADALTYCERFHPQLVIDIATLTGACQLALGPFASAVMGNHEPLIQALVDAGNASHDRVWNLPLWSDYHEALRSEHADFSNIPLTPIGAGTIIGGTFLSKFTKKYHWAHLDIANTANIPAGNKRGATGRPIPLLVQFLVDQL